MGSPASLLDQEAQDQRRRVERQYHHDLGQGSPLLRATFSVTLPHHACHGQKLSMSCPSTKKFPLGVSAIDSSATELYRASCTSARVQFEGCMVQARQRAEALQQSQTSSDAMSASSNFSLGELPLSLPHLPVGLPLESVPAACHQVFHTPSEVR